MLGCGALVSALRLQVMCAAAQQPPAAKRQRVWTVHDSDSEEEVKGAAPGVASSRHPPVHHFFRKQSEKRKLKLLLVRHSHTQGYDRLNTPLSQHGVALTGSLAAHLSTMDFQAVITSPLLRALQTTCLALGGGGATQGSSATPRTFSAEVTASWTAFAQQHLSHLTKSAPSSQTGTAGATAASPSACVPVFVSPLVRERTCCIGDVGEDGSRLAERLKAALARPHRTEGQMGPSGPGQGPHTDLLPDPHPATWSPPELVEQLHNLPPGWWVPSQQHRSALGQSYTGPGRETRPGLLKRVTAFRRSLALLPPHVTTVVVVAHNHFLKALANTRKGWDFCEVRPLTVAVLPPNAAVRASEAPPDTAASAPAAPTHGVQTAPPA